MSWRGDARDMARFQEKKCLTIITAREVSQQGLMERQMSVVVMRRASASRRTRRSRSIDNTRRLCALAGAAIRGHIMQASDPARSWAAARTVEVFLRTRKMILGHLH
jgi:hypothetical protein